MSEIHYFGIRHLSPNSSHNLIKLLDKINPDCVLIESPTDLNEQIENIVNENTKPPIAIMAYTLSPPVQSVLYPLAVYSPEYQAMLWAKKNNKQIKCIDLPSSSILAFSILEKKREEQKLVNLNNDETNNQKTTQLASHTKINVYDEIAKTFNCKNYDEFWEQHFEHLCLEDYQNAILTLAQNLREIDSQNEFDYAYNQIREYHMKRIISQTAKELGEQCKIVVATGAYHTPALTCEKTKYMSDQELNDLPKTPCNLTIMPYSYKRLSSRSGYGAGNNAPAYYEMLFELIRTDKVKDLPALYMTKIANEIRKDDGVKSSAEVIDATSLSLGLAAMKNCPHPTLYDLRDSATTCLGGGSLESICLDVAKVEIGQGIGKIAKNSRRTAIQDDFYKYVSKLKLDKYVSPFVQNIDLDLRENTRVKNAETAFLDLERSMFFYMLKILEIDFCINKTPSSAKTWAEFWDLCWSPECEIQLVECSLLGDTIKTATSLKIKEMLENASSLSQTANIIDLCVCCGLTSSFNIAKQSLIELSIKGVDFSNLASTISTLSRIIKYGDIHKVKTDELVPLLCELFLRSTLEAESSCNCTNEIAAVLADSFSQLEQTAQIFYEVVDVETWVSVLKKIAFSDSLNAIISGFACAILLDRKCIDESDFKSIVLKRLSVGTPADIGAGWFMGLAKKNKFSLLSRTSLWKNLDDYIATLNDEQFKRAVVFLRRAFCEFTPKDIITISETLANIWGYNENSVTDVMARTFSQSEIDKLNSAFEDFDLGDI